MKNAISLVELAIVIVIVGVLTVAVTGANVLINNSRLQKQIDQFEGFKRASSIFELTYKMLPGDFDEATSVFSGSNVVDGDGNGYINGSDGARRFEDRGVSGEKIHFFRHLSLAGLVDADYQAIHLNKSRDIPTTILDPDSGILAAGYLRPNVFGGEDNSGTYTTSDVGGIHVYLVMYYDLGDRNTGRPAGTPSGNLSAGTDERIFLGKDMHYMDTKIDDSFPDTGDLMGFRVGCTDSDYTVYDLTNTLPQCYAMYKIRDI